MTTSELLNAVLQYRVNQGSSSIVEDIELRKKAWFGATKTAKRVWNAAPHWWRVADGSVVLTSGVGTMPADYSHDGTQAGVYISGNTFQNVVYASPDVVKALIQTQPQTGTPRIYTLSGHSALGVPKILCWPQDNSTLLIKAYVKKTPELIDAPLAPVLAQGAATGLTGAFTGRVTFVTAAGEVEGGVVSASVSVTNSKLNWSSINTWWGRTVTARKLYRTLASGLQHNLVATISDNLATTYTGDAVDVTATANVPTPATAVSGLEVFPEQFHESAIFDGLVAWFAEGGGDGRDPDFSAKWDQSVRRLWQEIKQGQNVVNAFPPFPGYRAGHPMWSRFSPPQ